MAGFFKSVKSLTSLTFGKNKYDGANNWTKEMGKFTDLDATDIDGNPLKFDTFNGQVLIMFRLYNLSKSN